MNVQVILNEDLPYLGRTGDVVKVRAGYALRELADLLEIAGLGGENAR